MGKYWNQVIAINQSTEFSPAGSWHRAKLGRRITTTQLCTGVKPPTCPAWVIPFLMLCPCNTHQVESYREWNEPRSIPVWDKLQWQQPFWERRLWHPWPPLCSASRPLPGKDHQPSNKTRKIKQKIRIFLICQNKAHNAILTIHINYSVSNLSPYVLKISTLLLCWPF